MRKTKHYLVPNVKQENFVKERVKRAFFMGVVIIHNAIIRAKILLNIFALDEVV